MEFSEPFFHLLFDDFLPSTLFEQVKNFYNTRKFELKYSDLFKFLQTEELADDIFLNSFKKELDTVFKNLLPIENTFYTIFASYYRKGDFLSCHDDMVENRLYAFTFYLDDLDSGDLVLFNNECNAIFKKISIRKNRLVIFQVSNLSYHEVEICKKSGRQAITGWINKKGHSISYKEIPNSYKLPNIEFVPFDLFNIENDVTVYEGIKYNFDNTAEIIDCNFIMRKVISLVLDSYVALDIVNYKLLYIDSFLINSDSYILLNDFTNNYEGDLLDIFIIESSLEHKGNIKYVNEDGILVNTLDLKNDIMYIVKRKKMKYFIERGFSFNYKMVHMIYKVA